MSHSVHALKEGTIEGNTAIARLRLVHRDETHLAVLCAGDEVFAELALAAQRLCKCYEKGGGLLSLRCEAEKVWINITFKRHRRKGSVHLQRHRTPGRTGLQSQFGPKLMRGQGKLKGIGCEREARILSVLLLDGLS